MADTQSDVSKTRGPTRESQASEAFDLLGDETRLSILLALWEAYEPMTEDRDLSFSELYDRVEYDNPGNFSYHLDRLTGQYIRKGAEDDGYELRNTGLEVVRTVIAGAGVSETRIEPTEIDRPCGLCGAPTTVSYDDGVLYQCCTSCGGLADRDNLPPGYLHSMQFHPAGLVDRTPAEALEAAEVAAYRHMHSMFQGLCSACSGPVDARLEVCSDHESGGHCPSCGRVPRVTAQFECRVCKDFHGTTPEVLVGFHPTVVAFYHEHGVAPRWLETSSDSLTPIEEYDPVISTEVVADHPPQVEITISMGSDDLSITFDATLRVVNIDR